MSIYNNFFYKGKPGSAENDPAAFERVGAFLPVEVRVPPKIAAILTKEGKPVPGPVAGAALIDTGATVTCVHEPVLKTLGLNPVGVAMSGTAGGAKQQYLYPAMIGCPSQKWEISADRVVGVDLTGQNIPIDPPQELLVLIGRNVLRHWVLIWNGPGGFWTVGF